MIHDAVLRGTATGHGYQIYRLWFTGTMPTEPAVAELQLVTRENPGGVPTGGTPSALRAYRPAAGAFDGNLGSYWDGRPGARDPALPLWLQYDFGQEEKLLSYRIGRSGGGGFIPPVPPNWEFQASNDGINWDVLDTQSDQSFSTGEIKEFPL